LSSTPAPEKDAKTAAAAEEDNAEMRKFLEDLYDKHEGSIESIFEELNENPGKAIKYPPADKSVFATKYQAGFYTYVGSRAEAK